MSDANTTAPNPILALEEHEEGVPTVDSSDILVERTGYTYEDALKPAGSFVVSGPLPGAEFKGREFPNWSSALAWALDQYGGYARTNHGRVTRAGVVGLVRPTQIGRRWAIRVATEESIDRARPPRRS
mgnify:CR=1 FL=1